MGRSVCEMMLKSGGGPSQLRRMRTEGGSHNLPGAEIMIPTMRFRKVRKRRTRTRLNQAVAVASDTSCFHLSAAEEGDEAVQCSLVPEEFRDSDFFFLILVSTS